MEYALTSIKALSYDYENSEFNEYVNKASKYLPLGVCCFCVLILILPTLICLACEGTKHKCCYGCIDCWMPV